MASPPKPAAKATPKPVVYVSYATLAGAAAAGVYAATRTVKLTRGYLADRDAAAAYARDTMPPAAKPAVPQPRPAAAVPAPRPIESADPNPRPGVFGALKEVYYEFAADDVMTQAAALAFYTGLALAPLLTIVVWAAHVFLPANKKLDITQAFTSVMGEQAAAPIKALLDPASQSAPTQMTVAGVISILIVAFSASGVFAQVQSALNSIWHVQSKPSSGLIGFIQKRVLSLGMMASILFLLMTSLIVSTSIQVIFGNHHDEPATFISHLINIAISVGLFTVLFAALFKFVPDAKIGWKPVWVGGFLSSVLFTVGKFGLSIYLGRSSYATSYAAFGSFVAMLVWVYYSAVIVLVGAEATEVYARRHGHALEPDKHAVRVVQTTEPA